MGAYKTTVSKKIHLAGYPELRGNDHFMITLFATGKPTKEFLIIFGIMPECGIGINFFG